jgi:hypothetical protein
LGVLAATARLQRDAVLLREQARLCSQEGTLNSEDRSKMLRMVWQVFTVLSVLIIVFGGGWGAVTVLLGLALMTVLATAIIMRVGLLTESTDSRPTRSKAKRSDTERVDSLAAPMRDTEGAALRIRLPADGSVLGDDGEIVALGALNVGKNTGGQR